MLAKLQTKIVRGAARVQPGSLAVSRSIGDCALKSMHEPALVIAEADTFTCELDDTCMFLIIATDGVWGGGGGNFTSNDACRNVQRAIKQYIKNSPAVDQQADELLKGGLSQSASMFNRVGGASYHMNVADYAAWHLVKACVRSAESRNVACDNTSAIVVMFDLE